MGKKLLSSGCSYTDRSFRGYYPQYPDFKEWPYFVSNSLNLTDLNVAESGNSNQKIAASLIPHIATDNIDTVMVLWSGWDRWEFMFDYHIVTQGFLYQYYVLQKDYWKKAPWIDETEFDVFFQRFLDYNKFIPARFIRSSIDSTLSQMYTIAKLCESKQIKYIFQQGVNPIDFAVYKIYSDKNLHKMASHYLLQHKLFSHLEKRKDHIIGWPFLKDLGGNFLEHDRILARLGSPSEKWPEAYDNTEEDKHPNPMGHKIIAETFLERYREIYDR